MLPASIYCGNILARRLATGTGGHPVRQPRHVGAGIAALAARRRRVLVPCHYLLLVLASLGAQPTWEILGLDARLIIDANQTTIHVDEIIHVNSGPHPHRVLDRELPTLLNHPLVGRLPVRVRVRSVTRAGDIPVFYQVEEGPHYLAVHIGHPDSTKIGDTIYRLEYDVDGAIVHGMNRSSLTWPVAGGEWEAQIIQLEAVVQLPTEASASEVLAGSFTGYFGDHGRAADMQITDPNRLLFRQLRGLKAHERFTIHASWPRAAAAGGGAAGGAGAGTGAWILPLALVLGAVLVFIYLRRRATAA